MLENCGIDLGKYALVSEEMFVEELVDMERVLR